MNQTLHISGSVCKIQYPLNTWWQLLFHVVTELCDLPFGRIFPIACSVIWLYLLMLRLFLPATQQQCLFKNYFLLDLFDIWTETPSSDPQWTTILRLSEASSKPSALFRRIISNDMMQKKIRKMDIIIKRC